MGWICAGVEGAPTVCEAAGDDCAELLRGCGEVAASIGVGEVREDAEGFGVGGGRVKVSSEVEFDGLAGMPVGGDLQDRGTAKAAVSDQHLFAEGAVGCSRLRGGLFF